MNNYSRRVSGDAKDRAYNSHAGNHSPWNKYFHRSDSESGFCTRKIPRQNPSRFRERERERAEGRGIRSRTDIYAYSIGQVYE